MRIKKRWITLAVIILVIAVAYFILSRQKPETPEEVAKCIGSKSVLYVQLGCYACGLQEDMFGENYKHLNKIDCWFEQEKCLETIAKDGFYQTPTWIINGKKYEGVQTIEKLKELTGC